MRVNAETKAATRQRILEAARRLFAEQGYEATTTRDIARAAEIATGTLFNYFATKEAIVECQAGEALSSAGTEFESQARDIPSLEEALFAFVAAGLRKLKPLRKHLPSLLQTSLSPLAESRLGDETSLRLAHLDVVSRLAEAHGHSELSPVALQLYWTLYTGVLVFWAQDKSPKQEDTLALLDHSLAMFVTWLDSQGEPKSAKNPSR
ncbi:MAG TPA: TetR/AcrR family transcriptional regulator [Nitrospiraceae bacterium]|nr:TetR/AcrR family transcriptional regulator [Nitrospiraceae bacterium]